MKIGIAGYYGQGNFGDELFLDTFKQVFHEHTVYPIVKHMDYFSSDSVIVGGGDLIIPYSYNDSYFPKGLIKLPTWVYGVGIVDFYPPETWPKEEVEKYREVITHAKGLYVRDSNSLRLAEYLKLNANIKKVPDIAFSYKQPNYPIIKNPNKKTLGVCSFSYEEFPLNKIAKILSTLSPNEYTISLIAVVDVRNRFSDLNTCLKLKETILKLNPKADIVIKNYQYLDVTYSHIQNLDYLVSFKLHPSLVGIRNNVPTFCLSKLSKVRSLLQAFDLEDFFCDYEEEEAVLQAKLEHVLKNGKNRMSQIAYKIKEMEQLSDISLAALKKEIENLHHS
ncbi:polysaccharide pyruvyl transferase family protein [Sutcliffiella horikoshii]|uniref:polysaccharide pyruvyl transferase family protein n=1 Tax=Sutcliffiella horikoshii TaxID=79883 RepID=UPI00384FA050